MTLGTCSHVLADDREVDREAILMRSKTASDPAHPPDSPERGYQTLPGRHSQQSPERTSMRPVAGVRRIMMPPSSAGVRCKPTAERT
jgi:hypothetical protein